MWSSVCAEETAMSLLQRRPMTFMDITSAQMDTLRVEDFVFSRNQQTPTKNASNDHLSHINKYLYVWIH